MYNVQSRPLRPLSIEGADGTFGVIEAKMGSPLSAGTKNAPGYDQASRSLACIAFNTLSKAHNIFFAVAAPRQKMHEHGIEEQVNVSRMTDKIAGRFDMYESDSKVHALKERVLKRARTCTCFTLSYESWLDALSDHEAYTDLVEFKDQCYRFNRIG